MLDNTIITKFELSEREKMLKRQFFKREEEPGKKYLFSRPPEKTNDSINKLNYTNNSQSLSLDQNYNSKISNQLNNININTSNNDKNINTIINNNINKNINQSEQKINKNLSNSIPDIKNITQQDMNKFYEEAANYLPKSNGGMTSEQINLLMHQNKIMQRNVDALQETNRSLQDFIIYTIKKDSMKNKISDEANNNGQNNVEYNKLNKLLTPLYNHINNLESQVKELNKQKREDEINVELDDLIIKNQKNFKPKYIPQTQSKKRPTEDEKNNKIMMKTLTSLKGTMTNMTEQMKKIGNTFNEKMQKVLEDTEKNKLKAIVGGGRANSTINNSKINLKNKNSINNINNLNNGQSNNISIFKENGGNPNESILKNKLDNIDYESFKLDLIDIGNSKDAIVSDYKAGAPEFPKLTKPKSKIKFSYNLDKELNNIMDKVNNKAKSKPKFSTNLYKNDKNKNPSMKEKVSNAINKEKKPKDSKNIPSNQKNYENKNKNNINKNINKDNDINNNIYNNKDNKDNNDYENKMKELNEMSVVDKMNLYKERMAQLSGSYEVKENDKNNPKLNQENINPIEDDNINNLGSNHSGVTFQKFNKPSTNQIQNKNKYNPPKVKYGVFHGQKGIPNYNPNLNENEQPKVIIPEIVLPKPDKLNNVIKDTIDNYLTEAFKNLKPSEAPKINLNNENNKNPPQQNAVQRVIEKEYIIKNVKEVQNVPQPIVINPPPQQNPQPNNELMEKFLNLAEKFTNLEEKINQQMHEEKIKKEEKIEIIKKEKIEKPQQPEKKVILPDTDLISKLVMDKIKRQMNIDINIRQQNQQPQPPKNVVIPKEEEKKEEKINIFDINQNLKMEELDEKIRMPHKINLAEYEVSQTSSYLSESLQKNNFNMNSNNLINYNKININVDENYNNEININQNNDNIENSKSEGEISNNDNDNSSRNDEYIPNRNNNNINNNKTGIDLLKIKHLNEQIPNQINMFNDNFVNKNESSDNNVVNIAQIAQNNNYNDYLNFLNDKNNNINPNMPVKSLNPFNTDNMDGNSNDNFFNDSGENN